MCRVIALGHWSPEDHCSILFQVRETGDETDHEFWSMTTQELFWQMPEHPILHMATKISKPKVPPPPGIIRSSSDSVVISKGRPEEDGEAVPSQHAEHAEPLDQDIQREDVGVRTTAQGTLFVAARALPRSKPASSANKTRQQLQLPSFRALGIAVPYPTSILTPPDEPTSLTWPDWNSPMSDTTPTSKGAIPTGEQVSSAPLSPLPPGSVQESSNNTPTQGTLGSVVPSTIQSSSEASRDPTSPSTVPTMPSCTPWLEQALGAACTFSSQA